LGTQCNVDHLTIVGPRKTEHMIVPVVELFRVVHPQRQRRSLLSLNQSSVRRRSVLLFAYFVVYSLAWWYHFSYIFTFLTLPAQG